MEREPEAEGLLAAALCAAAIGGGLPRLKPAVPETSWKQASDQPVIHALRVIILGYLSFYPIVSIQLSCCDLSVREALRSRARGVKAT